MAFKRWTVRVRLSPPTKMAGTNVPAIFVDGNKARKRTGKAQPWLSVLASGLCGTAASPVYLHHNGTIRTRIVLFVWVRICSVTAWYNGTIRTRQ